jgi:hypothetical protein
VAKTYIRNAWVRINSVDLSDHVRLVTVNQTADELEVTAMGAYGRERLGGLRDDSFSIEFYQDWASSSVDQTLAPLMGGGSLFLVEVATNGTAISATAPKWSGTALLLSYTPIGDAVGEVAMATVDFPVNGTINRATA